jgi:hypothetical protein
MGMLNFQQWAGASNLFTKSDDARIIVQGRSSMEIAGIIPFALDMLKFQTTACVRILDHIQVIGVTATNVTHISDHAQSIGKIRKKRCRVLISRHLLFYGHEISPPINFIAPSDDHVV